MNKTKKERKKELSFTTYEKTCPDHVATEERLCYCDRASDDNKLKMCNKFNCWKFKKEELES